MDDPSSITITSAEAHAVIARLRHAKPPLHSVEVSLLGRLVYETKELDRELPNVREQLSFEFMGDV